MRKTMLSTSIVLALTLALTGCTGCASTDPDADALLVRTEQALLAGMEVADTFLRLEEANSEELARIAPWTLDVAQQIRLHGRSLHDAAWSAVEAYIAARDAVDKAKAAKDAAGMEAAESLRIQRREAMLLAAERFGSLVEQARLAISTWSKKGGGS